MSGGSAADDLTPTRKTLLLGCRKYSDSLNDTGNDVPLETATETRVTSGCIPTPVPVRASPAARAEPAAAAMSIGHTRTARLTRRRQAIGAVTKDNPDFDQDDGSTVSFLSSCCFNGTSTTRSVAPYCCSGRAAGRPACSPASPWCLPWNSDPSPKHETTKASGRA